MLTAEQLEVRRTGVGASEVAAVVGLSPYETALDVWARKTRRAGPDRETDAMMLGNLLEPVVLELYRQRVGPVVPAGSETLRHGRYRFALATPDGFAEDGARLVECKTAGARTREQWGDGIDEVPVHYLVQVQWQLLVTGRERAHLAALLLGDQDFRVYEIERAPRLIEQLVERVGRFWRDNVANDSPPDPGPEHASDYLAALYSSPTKELLPWTVETRVLARELAEIKAEKRALAAREKSVAIELQRAIGNAAGIGDQEQRVLWTPRAGGIAWKNVATALGATKDVIEAHRGPSSRALTLRGFGSDEEQD